MVDLVRRLMRVGGALDRVGLPSIEFPALDEIVSEMEKSHRKIEFSNGKKDSKRERIRCYKRLLRLSKRVFTLFKGRLTPLSRNRTRRLGCSTEQKTAGCACA